MVYGCMGGDGQPQFQAAFFTRAAMFGTGAAAGRGVPRRAGCWDAAGARIPRH